MNPTYYFVDWFWYFWLSLFSSFMFWIGLQSLRDGWWPPQSFLSNFVSSLWLPSGLLNKEQEINESYLIYECWQFNGAQLCLVTTEYMEVSSDFPLIQKPNKLVSATQPLTEVNFDFKGIVQNFVSLKVPNNTIYSVYTVFWIACLNECVFKPLLLSIV